MSRNTPHPDDDGRVIADMSGVERQNLLLPRFQTPRRFRRERDEQADRQPLDFELTPEEQRMHIWMALKAALLIALVFIVGLGAVVLLLIWLWS